MNSTTLITVSKEIEMTLADLKKRYSSRITSTSDKPEENIDTTIRALWLCASGIRMSVVAAVDCQLPELSRSQKTLFTNLLENRCNGVPLAYLTGRQNFMGLEFLCWPQVLIPRKETEILGTTALKIIQEYFVDRTAPRILDVCTGCGNLAISLAYYSQNTEVYASDYSSEAVALASCNSVRLNVNDRVSVSYGDLFNPFDNSNFYNSFDLIICNPPYITTKKLPSMAKEIVDFEPMMAFDGGHFGMSIVFRLVKESLRYLRKSGWLVFEIGVGQGNTLVKMLSGAGSFPKVNGIKDNDGNVRTIVCQFTGEA